MDNQHKKIKGYRDLSQEEIELMNEIKEKGQELQSLIIEIEQLREVELAQVLDPNSNACDLSKEQIHESMRCMNIAKKDLQTGVMWLTRSVALPNSF